MNFEIYRRKIKLPKLGPEGEEFAYLTVTEEHNGYAVWYSDYFNSATLVKWLTNRDKALEFGVSTEAYKPLMEQGLKDQAAMERMYR